MPNRGRRRGRGRGANNSSGRGRGQYIDYMDDFDLPIQSWPDNGAQNHNHRARGRGGSFSQQNSGATLQRGRGSPRGTGTFKRGDTPRGTSTPMGRGRGRNSDSNDRFQSPRGRGAGPGRSKFRPDIPLSKLLYEERPLLRPIVFVPSVYTRTLFEKEEELLQPQVEEIADGETSHVPTAERVARVFNTPHTEGLASDDDPEQSGELEEIDFEDMARIREEVDAATILTAGTVGKMSHATTKVAEEKFTDVKVDVTASMYGLSVLQDETISSLTNETIVHETAFCMDTAPSMDLSPETSPEISPEGQAGFYVDTKPSTFTSKEDTILIDRVDEGALLGEEDDIIVYVAPHPRLNKMPPVATDNDPVSLLPSTSILTGTPLRSTATQSVVSPSIPPAPAFDSVSLSFTNSPNPRKQPRTRPVFTVGERTKIKAKARKKEARVVRRRLERQAMFGQFGAIMSETQLRRDGEQLGKGRDPKWEERRRGDSDIDWGDTDHDEVGTAEVSDELGAMELDPDIDMDGMKVFVAGMSANEGKHVTMDDLADEERMRQEDIHDAQRRGDESGSEDSDKEGQVDGVEEEDVMYQEGVVMICEHQGIISSDDDDEDDSSDGIDQSPNAAFQSRLENLRKHARGKEVVVAEASSGEDNSDDDFYSSLTRAEEDEEFIAHLANNVLGSSKSNNLFRAIQNGDFAELEEYIGPARRKNKYVPSHLQDQWTKDRAKKAEYKKAREQARLEAAADPLLSKKGGKKGRKAMLKAAKFDASISIPEHIVDLTSLEQQIRRFLDDIGGHSTMVLPPMGKESRKQVHELAAAFKLKSISKGKGAGRYTTLTKTTMSGIGINAKKIARITKRSNGGFVQGASGKNSTSVPRHRDGDEVGKAAPKIGKTNIGFKMLASMGWSEGDRIGVYGGLDAPLTAVIKNTKLGLGANNL